jgi:hypothetical protein
MLLFSGPRVLVRAAHSLGISLWGMVYWRVQFGGLVQGKAADSPIEQSSTWSTGEGKDEAAICFHRLSPLLVPPQASAPSQSPTATCPPHSPLCFSASVSSLTNSCYCELYYSPQEDQNPAPRSEPSVALALL